MIDYNKLKIVHELYPSEDLKVIPIFDREGNLESFNYSMEIEGVMADYFYSIDYLIATLQELTQPKPKYEDGQEVWTPIYTNTMQPGKFKTDAHKYEDGVHQYCLIGNGVGLTWREENTIYPSREALIEAQIDYWTSLKNEDKSTGSEDASMESVASNPNGDCMGVTCEHESDEPMYRWNGVKSDVYKCKKCRKFYR